MKLHARDVNIPNGGQGEVGIRDQRPTQGKKNLRKPKPSPNLRNSVKEGWNVEAVLNARSLASSFDANAPCGTSEISERYESGSI